MITVLASGTPGILFPAFAFLTATLAFYGKEIIDMMKTYTSPATSTGSIILSFTASTIFAFYSALVPSL